MNNYRKIHFFLLTIFITGILTISGLAQDIETPVVIPPDDVFLDVDWYQEYLVTTVDLWNGGVDGNSGMGVYRDDFDGYFEVNLTQNWDADRFQQATTVIAHSRAIYMNVEAYRAAGSENGERFLVAIESGADYLLEYYLDDEYGGFYWSVAPDARVVDDRKQDYANVHPLLALAHAYDVTGIERYRDAAIAHLETLDAYFLDPDYEGGFLPGWNRDFTAAQGVNNVDSFTHYFESLMALYDITEGTTRDSIGERIQLEGDFLVNVLYNNQEGFDNRGYVAYNYSDDWTPSQIPYERGIQWAGALHATTGHNVELAYLLSRAVERGFDETWLDTADKLMRFALTYAIDEATGGMIYDTTDYEGNPLNGNPDNPLFIWWAQGETARALLHFIVVRDETSYLPSFMMIQTLINEHFTDTEYGGWFSTLDGITLQPTTTYKGNIWKVNYHFSMYYAEVLRLAEQYEFEIDALIE